VIPLKDFTYRGGKAKVALPWKANIGNEWKMWKARKTRDARQNSYSSGRVCTAIKRGSNEREKKGEG